MKSISLSCGRGLWAAGFVLAFGLGAAPAVAADSPFTGATASPKHDGVVLEAHGVAFGMNADAIARLYDRWWDKHFVPKYRKANPGPKMRELDFELAEQKKVLRRVAHFDGRSRSFDKSEFFEEFAHGNGETMTSVKVVRRGGGDTNKGVTYTRRFFFFKDRLWKVYDEYRLEPNGLFGADFKEATTRIEASLGEGTKRTRGPESKWENVVFENGNTRVRVVKLPTNRVAVVRSDNALAREVLDQRVQHAAALEQPLDADIQAILK
jgi:hypothetical protein